MGRPRLIILIRHAQSEGNKNRDIHQTVPDHRVKLTQDGWAQAYDAGRRLRSLLRPDDTVQFFTSPYRRTRETTEGILSTLTSDDPEPTPFKRDNIKVYEEPRLREQDFGNFQPCSAEMERMWQERADYGHFFYRIPNGESAADAYDRVSGFNESLWRQFGEDDFPSVCVLVTHGLMSRVFLMKWYHFSVEYFEDLRNVNHCEFLIMEKQSDSGKYILQKKLRTWSELRRERAALKAKEAEEDQEKDKAKDKEQQAATPTKVQRQNSVGVPQRRWGGCPQGCNHLKHFKIRRDIAELLQVDEHRAAKSSSVPLDSNGAPLSNGNTNGNTNGNGTIASRRPGNRVLGPNNSEDDSDDPRGHDPPRIDITKAREDIVSSPDGTPSFITVDDRLRAALQSPPANGTGPSGPNGQLPLMHVGRDGGGTYSGHASAANSDTEEISQEDARQRLASRAARVRGTKSNGALNGGAGSGGGASSSGASSPVDRDAGKYLTEGARRAHANRLGDAVGSCSDQDDGGDEAEDLDKAEKEDRSLRGSVY